MQIWRKISSNSTVAICCAIVISIFIVLYGQVIKLLINDWRTNQNYSHGFLIPIISIYMSYVLTINKNNFQIVPDNRGILLIIFGLVLLFVSSVASEFFSQRISIIFVLGGVILFIFGKEILQFYLFPLLYLIFMIPIPTILWNEIAFPLQIFSSYLSEKIINGIGISVYREGNILHLPGSSLEVIDACSGIRSLTAMMAIGAAFSWFKIVPLSKKILIFLCSFPITITANVIRLTITAILVNFYGANILDGFIHDFSGIFTFFVGFCLLAFSGSIIEKLK